MIETDKVYFQNEPMSDGEIIDRFRRMFGREMTEAERRTFFLDLPLSKEKTSANL
jgi:hypothetical protein